MREELRHGGVVLVARLDRAFVNERSHGTARGARARTHAANVSAYVHVYTRVHTGDTHAHAHAHARVRGRPSNLEPLEGIATRETIVKQATRERRAVLARST